MVWLKRVNICLHIDVFKSQGVCNEWHLLVYQSHSVLSLRSAKTRELRELWREKMYASALDLSIFKTGQNQFFSDK